MHTFSIGEALEFGWHKTREHSALLFKIVLTIFALQIANAVAGKLLFSTVLGALVALVLGIAGLIIEAGFTLIALRLAKGSTAHYRELIPQGKLLWRYFLASLLSGFVTAAGFILLILPGMYLAVRFSMVRFAVMEGAGVMESLRRSWHTTQGNFWRLLGFLLVLVGVNIVGAVLLYVGLLVSVPISILAWAHVYLKLKKA